MAIIGDGDLGKVLKAVDRSDRLFFASGVSNSQCSDETEYRRELDLLLKQPRSVHIVYFSSLSIFYADSRYTKHKRAMEVYIKENFPTHTIVRLGNINWGTNPNTLINYLKAHPYAPIRDEYRYVVAKKEFLHWISLIPDFSCEINIPGKMMKVQQIKERYVKNA